MATTSLGIPLVDFDTDQPNGAGQMNALAEAVDALIAARLLPAAHMRVGHATITSGLTSGVNLISGVWNLSYNVGDITYGGGIFTVARAGLYVWSVGLACSTAAAVDLLIFAAVNGVEPADREGAVGVDPHVVADHDIQCGGPLALSAGDTVQLALQFSATPSSPSIIPRTYSLYKVG